MLTTTPFKYGLALLALLTFTRAHAHDPSQITYDFNETGQLNIHLTPKGAFDVLQNIRPDLASESVIRLSDYYPAFTDYFNETIELTIAGQPIDFTFLKADLGKHDATIAFQLVDFPGDYDSYEISISSFTELYRRVNNTVSIPIPKGKHTFSLDDKKQFASYQQAGLVANGNTTRLNEEVAENSWLFFWVLASLGVLVVLGLSYRMLGSWQVSNKRSNRSIKVL